MREANRAQERGGGADTGEQWHSWQDEIFAGYPQQQRRWPENLAALNGLGLVE